MKHIASFQLFENSNQFSPELQQFMEEHGYTDPSYANNHAIRWASSGGRLEVVKELLKDPRVDPSAKNNFAIRLASFNGHSKVVKELLKDPRVDSSVVDLGWVRNQEIKKLLTVPKKLRDQLIHDDEDFDAFDEFGFFEKNIDIINKK